MLTGKVGVLLQAVALMALAEYPGSAGATVIIKTFHFSICVTGAKHPDGCKNAGADAHVVVSDDAMQSLDGQTGQAASITPLSASGSSPPGNPDHRQHRHRNPEAQQPGM
jgi:hypothetical protein